MLAFVASVVSRVASRCALVGAPKLDLEQALARRCRSYARGVLVRTSRVLKDTYRPSSYDSGVLVSHFDSLLITALGTGLSLRGTRWPPRRAGPAVLGAGSPSRAGEGSGPARRGCTCERERSRVGCDRPTTSPKGARRARTARRELAKLRGRKWAPCAHACTHAEASHRAARRLPSGTRPADQPTAAGVPRTADRGGRGVRRGRGTPAASSSEGAESSSLRSRR